jgi:hypothetical protein
MQYMAKTFTLTDMRKYLREIDRIENPTQHKSRYQGGPSRMVLHNLINYSRALNVLNTESAGLFFSLAN